MAHINAFAFLIGLVLISTNVDAQTRSPNPNAAVVLREWPTSGIWQTVLVRREDQSLACVMASGRRENGLIQYIAGLDQIGEDLVIVIGDRQQYAVSGAAVGLMIDNIMVNRFEITKRIDDKTELHMIHALIPKADSQRVINLFRAGGSVKFVTDKSTFEFPLEGAARALDDFRQCGAEVANLATHR